MPQPCSIPWPKGLGAHICHSWALKSKLHLWPFTNICFQVPLRKKDIKTSPQRPGSRFGIIWTGSLNVLVLGTGSRKGDMGLRWAWSLGPTDLFPLQKVHGWRRNGSPKAQGPTQSPRCMRIRVVPPLWERKRLHWKGHLESFWSPGSTLCLDLRGS